MTYAVIPFVLKKMHMQSARTNDKCCYFNSLNDDTPAPQRNVLWTQYGASCVRPYDDSITDFIRHSVLMIPLKAVMQCSKQLDDQEEIDAATFVFIFCEKELVGSFGYPAVVEV